MCALHKVLAITTAKSTHNLKQPNFSSTELLVDSIDIHMNFNLCALRLVIANVYVQWQVAICRRKRVVVSVCVCMVYAFKCEYQVKGEQPTPSTRYNTNANTKI